MGVVGILLEDGIQQHKDERTFAVRKDLVCGF
jgi:hypothetical protein